MSTEEDELEKVDVSEKEDDGFSWTAFITISVIVIAAVWALIHFNPSEAEHEDKIDDVLTEVVSDAKKDGYVLSSQTRRVLKERKYHSLGVVSWTSSKAHGKSKLLTFGVLGHVFVLFDVE